MAWDGRGIRWPESAAFWPPKVGTVGSICRMPARRESVDAHAAALDSVVRNLPGVDKVHFVAHSMGNIVIRRYLADDEAERRRRRDGPQISRIVMLAPPRPGFGTRASTAGNVLFRSLFGASGKQLGGSWAELERQLAIPSCPFGIVAGNFGNGVKSNPFLSGDDDLVVSVERTHSAGADDSLIVPAAATR